jgi:hypothetical protein
VPLLDQLFARPIFQIAHLRFDSRNQPSRQSVFLLLRKLRQAGVLRVLREGSGPRPRILAFTDLLEIAEGRGVES